MAFPQIKKKFSLFGSPPKPSSLLTTYFPSSQEIYEDNNFITQNNNRENLEKLVLVADEYRDCINKLSKISKNLSKSLKDYTSCKGIDKSYAQCLQFTAQFYENHAEVQAKLYKALQKEFEILQKFWDKYSKKVAKDEKAHNDHVGDLDKQIKKISEKKSKKENKYMTSLASINSDIARARAEYVEEIKRREKHTHSVVSQIIFRLIEGQFVSFNDSLKKCGTSVAKIKESAPFAGQGMPLSDLDGFLGMQTKTLPPKNNNSGSNNDESILPERRRSYKIASISEMQKAAMNNKSLGTTSLTEEFEKINNKTVEEILSSKLKTPSVSISEKSSDQIFSISLETATTATTATTVVSDGSEESTNNETLVTATTEINPANSKGRSYSITNELLTSSSLSSLSIGIHDDDNPSFRDNDRREMVLPNNAVIETQERKFSITKRSGEAMMIIDSRKNSINDNEKSSTKLEENYMVSLSPPPKIYDKSRDTNKYNNKRSSLKNEEEINQLPIKNTFRVSFIENNCENNESEKPTDEYNSNECNEDGCHYKGIRSTSPTDWLERSIPQTFSNSHQHSNDDERCVAIHKKFENNDTDITCESPTHSTMSYRDRPLSGQYGIQLRRSYTEYDCKRGPSVADIRERFLSLNSNERKLSTSSTRDPKPRQGYVNEVRSKFGSMNSSRNHDIHTKITRDDMYPDQIENSEEINSASSSKPIINEQCNCHNCQEVRRAISANDARSHDSFLPEDDLKIFGKKYN